MSLEVLVDYEDSCRSLPDFDGKCSNLYSNLIRLRYDQSFSNHVAHVAFSWLQLKVDRGTEFGMISEPRQRLIGQGARKPDDPGEFRQVLP
jgi:hypothetical protein